MEKWYSDVRQLKDEYEEGLKVEEFCHYIWHSLRRLKIKDKGKFKQKIGPEFSIWVSKLELDFSEDLVKDIINNHEFWDLTWEVSRP